MMDAQVELGITSILHTVVINQTQPKMVWGKSSTTASKRFSKIEGIIKEIEGTDRWGNVYHESSAYICLTKKRGIEIELEVLTGIKRASISDLPYHWRSLVGDDHFDSAHIPPHHHHHHHLKNNNELAFLHVTKVVLYVYHYEPAILTSSKQYVQA